MARGDTRTRVKESHNGPAKTKIDHTKDERRPRWVREQATKNRKGAGEAPGPEKSFLKEGSLRRKISLEGTKAIDSARREQSTSFPRRK